jgi:hypothetical protein
LIPAVAVDFSINGNRHAFIEMHLHLGVPQNKRLQQLANGRARALNAARATGRLTQNTR